MSEHRKDIEHMTRNDILAISGQNILDFITENLLLLSSQAELLTASALAKSDETKLTTRVLDVVTENQERYGMLRLRIGSAAITAVEFLYVDVDRPDATHSLVEPRTTWQLSDKITYLTHHFQTEPIYEPFYGNEKFFSYAAMGDALATEGELYLLEPTHHRVRDGSS